jgi:hypothetical protein
VEGQNYEHARTKVGVVDKGHNVTSFNDEPINGLIADLADGDA